MNPVNLDRVVKGVIAVIGGIGGLFIWGNKKSKMKKTK